MVADPLYVSAALLLLAGLFGLVWLWPAFLPRCLLLLATHTLYRLHVLGRENLPSRGGALLVCNHVSYVDWLLVLAASPRPVRFVVFGAQPTGWLARRVYRWAGVINIDEGRPRGVVKGLRRASDA